jgi:primosomal protein N' (replication factor Y) (superfamily II helicase)
MFAEVGIPVPLGQGFSYRVPPELGEVRPGARVLCEFGRRKVLGIVLGVGSEPPPIDASRIKDLTAIVDREPVLPDELLAFLRELAAYYFAPIGEVLRLALPAVERDRVRALEADGKLAPGESIGRTRHVGGRQVLFASATDKVEEAGSLRGQAAAVLAFLRANGEQTAAALERQYGNARAALRKLSELGLARTETRTVSPAEAAAEAFDVVDAHALHEAQRDAVARIVAGLEPDGARAFLLFGITGSGKTEVYMHAIGRCLEKGRGALVLVPEIALTPQLAATFRGRFGDAVAVLHSGLGEPERHAMWRRLRSGELRLVVGARSALFAPVSDLGLVVVDEEHDGSFKQEEGVRYHARDMALLRAHRAGAVCVLGSATPSLEAVALAKQDRLVEIRLPERATPAPLPEVEIIDLRRMGPGPSGHKLLSLPLHRALEQALAAGEQTILFLNRRGFAPAIVCESCGHVLSCRLCSVALTYHRGPGLARCHYCDYASELPNRCQACSAPALSLEGLGTEKLEEAVAAAFPTARVGRLDRDVAAGARSAKILARMRAGDIDVLVGTQMVTKGHDLPNVTLVGVVNADAALSLPDFRAAERGFQLLVQVAGRAGRRERRGRVLIQTRDPGHAAVRFAASHDVPGFLAHELADRREVGYPPFRRIALLRVDASDEAVARRTAGRLAAHARSTPDASRGTVEVLGPAPAPIARLRGRYRFRVMLRAKSRAPLRAVLAALVPVKDELDRHARVAIDVDPVSML